MVHRGKVVRDAHRCEGPGLIVQSIAKILESPQSLTVDASFEWTVEQLNSQQWLPV
jgi:hypothetical protein